MTAAFLSKNTKLSKHELKLKGFDKTFSLSPNQVKIEDN